MPFATPYCRSVVLKSLLRIGVHIRGATTTSMCHQQRRRAIHIVRLTTTSRAFVSSTHCLGRGGIDTDETVKLLEQEEVWDDDDDDDDDHDDYPRRLGTTAQQHQRRIPHHHGLAIGSEHYGKVVAMKNFGVFVKINGEDIQGFVPNGEIADQWVENASWHVSKGQSVKVRVLEDNDDGKLRLSIKRVRPLLSEDFKPATIALFRVPCDMDEDEIRNLLGEYGTVLDMFTSWSYHEEFNTRQFVFCTFDDISCAKECIAKLNNQRVPYTIGNDTHTFQIKVKMSNQQNYKQKLQAELDEEWEEKMREWDMTPESRRAQRMADRALRDIIPYYDM